MWILCSDFNKELNYCWQGNKNSQLWEAGFKSVLNAVIKLLKRNKYAEISMDEAIVWLCSWRQNAFAWSANPSGGSDLVAASCCICISFDSPSNQTILCTPTVTSPLPYLPVATADIILNPISNKTPPLTFCFVFNKSARQHPHIPLALRKGIYHSGVDQIWHTPSCAGNSQGGYTHTVDLLAWYTGQSKIKYVPQDISHLSWNCHKPIFTARTSRNWKRENTVASWPSKQSSGLATFKHTVRTENAEISSFHWIWLQSDSFDNKSCS